MLSFVFFPEQSSFWCLEGRRVPERPGWRGPHSALVVQASLRRARGSGAAEDDCPEPAGSPRGENVIANPVQKRGVLL